MADADRSQPLPGAPRPAWDLPRVVDIQVRRVPFQPRQPRNFKSALSEFKEAVEFLVRTDGPIPARALPPALFVGEQRVVGGQRVEPNLYRFLGFQPQAIQAGAAIQLGWLDGPPESRQKTRFRVPRGVGGPEPPPKASPKRRRKS